MVIEPSDIFHKLVKDLRRSVVGQIAVGLLLLTTLSHAFSSPSTPSNTQLSPSPSPISSLTLSPTSQPYPSPSSTPQPRSEEHLVTKVIDGDTIVLDNGEVVRYIGIDTPEIRAHSKGGPDCYALEAKVRNKELVLNKKVRLVKDVSNRDRYHRLLRYVYVGDTFINETLVREGYAKVATYPPDVKYVDLFRQAEQEARQRGRGLWSSSCE